MVKSFHLFFYCHISPCAGSSRVRHFTLPLKQITVTLVPAEHHWSVYHHFNSATLPNLCATSANTESEAEHFCQHNFGFRTPVGPIFPKDLCGFGVTHQPTGWLSFPPRCRSGHRRAPGPRGCSHSRCRNEWLQKLQQGGEITAEPPAWSSSASRDRRETGTNLARSNRTL